MNHDVISCISSKSLRVYLKRHPCDLSILQQATIISVYADDKAKPEMFRRLIEQSEYDNEKLLQIPSDVRSRNYDELVLTHYS